MQPQAWAGPKPVLCVSACPGCRLLANACQALLTALPLFVILRYNLQLGLHESDASTAICFSG